MMLRRSSITGALAVALLLAGTPSAVSATDKREARDGVTSPTAPVETSMTGGVAVLRAPASKMILVRKSEFDMGSSPDDVVDALSRCTKESRAHHCEEGMFGDEMPQRRIRLSAFWLDRTEVTVAEYRRCVELRRCAPVPFAQGGRRFDRPRFPASLVRWKDAADFCRFREARLPTEAEFERAARGTNGRRFPWGRFFNSRAANHGRFAWSHSDTRDGYAELAPVGSFPQGRTPDGFLDLAGNVNEWTSDRYLPRYDESDRIDPKGPKSPAASRLRSVRGGSFRDGEAWLRGASRTGADPGIRRPHLGFRCARSVPTRAP